MIRPRLTSQGRLSVQQSGLMAIDLNKAAVQSDKIKSCHPDQVQLINRSDLLIYLVIDEHTVACYNKQNNRRKKVEFSTI